MIRWLLLVTLGVTLGCFGHSGGPPPPVLRAPADAGTILFMGVDLPTAGSVIGGHFGALNFEVRQSSYQLTESVRARWSLADRDRGEAIMRSVGFRVRSVGPSSSDARRLNGVQYGLEGHVIELGVRSAGSSEPLTVDAQVGVSWELLDLAGGSAVFGRLVHGIARVAGTVDSAVGEALDNSLLHLLGDSLFLRALAAPRADPDAGSVTRFSRPVPPERETIVLADSDLNPGHDTSMVTRVAAGLATLRGQDRSYGTAIILTRDGLAIAVGRSVRNADRLRARLSTGVERPAHLVRSNAALDVALIQIACAEACPTVDWIAPDGVDVFTGIVAVGAPETDELPPTAIIGRVGGRWGLANGVTLEGTSGLVGSGWPVASTSSGRVFGLVSSRPGRVSAALLSEVLRALRVRPPEERTR